MLIKRAAVGTASFILCLWTPAEVLYGQARAGLQGRRRINESVDERRIVRLTNTTHLRIRRALDNGRVSADLPMERVCSHAQEQPGAGGGSRAIPRATTRPLVTALP